MDKIIVCKKDYYNLLDGIKDLANVREVSFLLSKQKQEIPKLIFDKVESLRKNLNGKLSFKYSLFFLFFKFSEVEEICAQLQENEIFKPSRVVVFLKYLEDEESGYGNNTFSQKKDFIEKLSKFFGKKIFIFLLNNELGNGHKLDDINYKKQVQQFFAILLFSNLLEIESFTEFAQGNFLTGNFILKGVNYFDYLDFIHFKIKSEIINRLLKEDSHETSNFSNLLKKLKERVEGKINKDFNVKIKEVLKLQKKGSISTGKISLLNSPAKNTKILKKYCKKINNKFKEEVDEKLQTISNLKKEKEKYFLELVNDEQFFNDFDKLKKDLFKEVSSPYSFKILFKKFFIDENSTISQLEKKISEGINWKHFPSITGFDCENLKISHPRISVFFLFFVAIVIQFLAIFNPLLLLSLFPFLVYILFSFYHIRKIENYLIDVYITLSNNINNFFEKNYFNFFSLLKIFILENIKKWGQKEYKKIEERLRILKKEKEQICQTLSNIKIDNKTNENIQKNIEKEIENLFKDKDLIFKCFFQNSIDEVIQSINKYEFFLESIDSEKVSLDKVLNDLCNNDTITLISSTTMLPNFKGNTKWFLGVPEHLCHGINLPDKCGEIKETICLTLKNLYCLLVVKKFS